MSGTPASSSQLVDPLFERVLRRAELAAAPTGTQVRRGMGGADLNQAGRERLVEAALRELARRTERARFLPDEIFSDTGWLILLDLFVCHAEGQRIPLSDSAHRWGIGEGTALRQIAGLIAHGLITRATECDAQGTTVLQLTHDGLAALSRTLECLE